ncbi:MAG: tetratricopeptide repeat protein [Planctomycetota bacterium]|nr:tetratricopeptide repeat protein [Planctomycetota bacterium]
MKRYIPDFIESNYAARRFLGRFVGSALCADISGFTALMETAFAAGERGAEMMSRQIARIFTPPVRFVLDRGGTITGFAGDSFSAVFPADDGGRARSAAEDIARFFAESGGEATPDGVFDFAVKCGVDAGEIHWGITEDAIGRCCFYFRGLPIDGAAALQQSSSAGEIAVSNAIKKAASGPESTARRLPDPPTREPNDPKTLSAFIQDEILQLGDKPEIRPIASVFVGLGRRDDFEPLRDHEEIGAVLSCVRDCLIAGGGTFNKVDFGDKGMTAVCFFGAPRASEKPVVAALNFVDQLRTRLRTMPGVAVRVGVDSGIAYAGHTGSELRNEWTCLGDCVNMSARLMVEAPWGATLGSARVQEAASQLFEFKPLGARTFKGKSRPEPVFQCERASPRTAAWVYESAMVGRQAELQRLHEMFERTVKGEFAGVACIYGEAGMGKTRLVQAFRKNLERSGGFFHWVHLPCFEHDSGLKPIAVWLERFFDVNAFSSREEKRARIQDRMDAIMRRSSTPDDTRRELKRTLSFLASLVDCRWEGSPFSQVSDPRLRYENQLYAVKELVKALAFEAPLVLEVEDAHWMEPSTTEWLKTMTRNVARVPFIAVLTSRYLQQSSGGAGPEAAAMMKPGAPVEKGVPFHEIELRALDNDLVAAIFEQRIRRKPCPALIEFLALKTEGNPFFVDQMAAHLKDAALLVETPDGMALEGDMGRLPATLDSLLLARFDQMEAYLRDGLKHAATLGVRFLRQVLEELLRRSEHFSGRPEGVIPPAQRKGFVVPESLRTTVGGEAAYLFRHALMQKAAYHLQPPSLRACVHRLAGEVIENLFAGRSEFFREIADHYGAGEMPAKEVEYLEKAAAYADETYKNSEAIALFLRLFLRLTDDPSTDAQARTAKGRISLARVYQRVGKPMEAAGQCEQAVLLAERLGDAHLVVDAGSFLATVYRHLGRVDDALKTAISAVKQARAAGYAQGEGFALGNTGTVYWALGDYTCAMTCFQDQLNLSDRTGDRPNRASALGNIGLIHAEQGNYARAIEYYRESMRLAEELGLEGNKLRAIGNIGVAYTMLNDYQKAMECYQQQLQIAERFGDRTARALAIGNMGTVYKGQGDSQRARECFKQQLDEAEEIGDKSRKALAIGNTGDTYFQEGDYAKAKDFYEKALQIGREIGGKRYEAYGIGGIGTALLRMGACDEAIEKIETALGLWRGMNCRQQLTDLLVYLAEAHLGGIAGVESAQGETQPPGRAGLSAMSRAQRLEEARKALREARALAQEFGQRKELSEVERVEGLLAMRIEKTHDRLASSQEA